jgi:hypothetical protein
VKPNPASSVDAPIAFLFEFECHCRRATYQHRSAKTMKVFTALAVFLVLGSFGCAPRESKPRSQLLDEIIEAQGLRQLAEQTKAAAAAEAKEAGRMSYEQMKQRMPSVQKEILEKIRLASDKYTQTVMAAWSVEDSMAVWKEKYGAEFSEDELRQILAQLKSPLGQKELAASKQAVAAWRFFITERQKAAAEAAMKEQGQAIQRAISETKAARE